MPSTAWGALAAPATVSTTTSISTAVTPGALFVQDTFSNGVAGVSISSRDGELGASWTQHTSLATSVVVLSVASRARDNGSSPNGSFYYASGLPGSADYSVSANITKLSALPTAVLDVLARVSSTTDDRYGARYSTLGTPGWSLYKVVKGVGAGLGSAFTDTIPNGDTRTVMLRVRGSDIQVFVDGTSRISVTDSSLTLAGRVGIGGANISAAGTDSTGLALDNFAATTLDSTTTSVTTTTSATPVPAWAAQAPSTTSWTSPSAASTAWALLG